MFVHKGLRDERASARASRFAISDNPVMMQKKTLTDPMPDVYLYEVLEVSPTARSAVIRAAYRCLVQEYHPDRNPGDPDAGARMSLINRAYSVLGDPQLRARYDQKMGIGATERRGSRSASTPARADSGGGVNLRPFAFRPLD